VHNNNNNDKIFCANHGIIEFPTLISKFLICIIFVTYLFFLHKLFNKIICGFTVYMYVYRSDQIRSGQVRSGQVRFQVRSGQIISGQIRFQIRSGQVRSDQISFQIRSVFRPDQIGFLSNLTWSDLFGALERLRAIRKKLWSGDRRSRFIKKKIWKSSFKI